MTVEQVKLKRDRLEEKIEALINEFNDETQVFVERVEVDNKVYGLPSNFLIEKLNTVTITLEKL